MKKIFISVLVFIFCLTLTGCGCEKKNIKISFDTDGGTKIEEQNIKKGDTIVEPSIPTKDGYIFDGWYYNGEKFDFSTKVTENIELEARWIKKEGKTYTIKFDTESDDEIEIMKVEEGKKVNLPTPIKNGYKFVGWFLNDKKVENSIEITEDIILVAKWEKDTTKTTKKYNTTTKKNTNVSMNENSKEEITNTTTTPTTKYPETTTKVTVTTTKKEDIISYEWVELKDDTINQATLYILKNGKRVSGVCDITTNSGKTVTKKIPKTGYTTSKTIIKSITNVKAD